MYEDDEFEHLDDEVVDTIHELKTVKDRVKYILKHYPETRNDDMYLWLIYVRLFDKELSKYIKFIPYEVLKRATKFETIRRVRQKIQNEEGLYPPTNPKVRARRRRKQELWRRAMPYV